jgi:hypothetical protein
MQHNYSVRELSVVLRFLRVVCRNACQRAIQTLTFFIVVQLLLQDC